MINYTMGTGGDFVDVGAMFSYFAQRIGTFINDVHVSLLNDIYNNNSVLDVNGNPFGGSLYLDGHNFAFNLMGHKIIFNAKIVISFIYDYYHGHGIVEIYGGIIQGASEYTYDTVLTIYYGSNYGGVADFNQIIKIHDILFLAKSANSYSTMLELFQASLWCSCQVYNCRFYIGAGFGLRITGNTSGGDPGVGKVYKTIENVSIYGIGSSIGILIAFASENLVFKNTVICRDPGGYQAGYPSFSYNNTDTGLHFINCADCDGSLNGLDAGSVHGITDADFVSVDPTNPYFLDLPLDTFVNYVSGKVGQCFEFSPFSGPLKIPAAAENQFGGTSKFQIKLYYRWNTSVNHWIFFRNGFGLVGTPGSFFIVTGNGSQTYAPLLANYNTWYLLTFVYDKGKFSLSLNGVLLTPTSTVVYETAVEAAKNNPFYLGGDISMSGPVPNNLSNGIINLDEIQISQWAVG